MEIQSFEAKTTAVGGSLWVEGKDVNDKIAGFDVSVRKGQPTQVTIYTIADAGSIDGEGLIRVVSPGLNLDELDLDSIEEEAMNRMGFDSEEGDKTLTGHIVDIIKEKMS